MDENVTKLSLASLWRAAQQKHLLTMTDKWTNEQMTVTEIIQI